MAAKNSVLLENIDLAGLRRTLRTSFCERTVLQLEILALRHQLQVLERTRPRRVRLTRSDRLLWVWLSRVWQGWRSAVVIVKPETVLAWHRRGFRLFWAWKSRHQPGRPEVPPGRPRFDSHDGGREPVVGCAAHSR